jgi:hypothetical protein
MIYVITYKARSERTSFLPNFYNGSARHTAKADAQHTLRNNISRYPDAQVREFANMAEAGKWLNTTNEAERTGA